MKRMNKIGRTILAGMTACTMGFTGISVYAEEGETKPENGTGKDETVYVITDASGDKQSVIVSDWLKNTEGSGTLLDESSLKDIENVSGNETYERNADGTITWKADGKDIYYRGTSDAELPVSVKISYQLNGKDISAEDIAGKSGHVRVRFDYTNDTEQTVKVKGKEETVKVPFAMITGVQIDQEKFSNINVTNGKLISEGSNSFLVGIAFPGLKESLNTEELTEKISDKEIPDYIEFEADTTGFELGMTMTVAGNNLLKDFSIDGDTDMSELSGKMDQLTDAADQLSEGTQTLKDGTGALREGTDKLKNGASALKDGTGKVKDGSEQLDSGAAQLADGTSALKEGTDALAAGAGTLAEGTGTLSDGAKKIDEGAAALKEGTDTLAAGTKKLADGTTAIAAGADTLKKGTAGAVTGSKKLAEGAKSVADGTAKLQTGVNQLKDGIEKPAEEGGVSLKDGAEAMSTQISSKIQELNTQKQGLETLKKSLFKEVGTTAGYDSDLVLAKQYQDVLNAAQKLGQAQAEAAAAQKQTLMQKTIDTQNETISDQKETIDTLQEENEELKGQANTEEITQTSETEDNSALLQARIDELEAELKASEEAVPEPEENAEPETPAEDTSELQNRISELEAKVAEYEASAEEEQPAADPELQAKAEELQTKLDAALAENTELQNQVSSLQEENRTLSAQVEEANQTISSRDGEIAALKAENESLKAAQPADSTAEEPAEPTAAGAETAEDMLVLTGNETVPADVQTAAAELEKAKQAYSATVSAMLANPSTNDALIVSQIDETIAIINTTIGDETTGLTALKNGAAKISEGIGKVDAGVNQLAAGLDGDGTEKNPGLVKGAAAVAQGASDLAAGAKTLDTGAGTLKKGIAQVAAGAGTVNEGAGKAAGGAKTLKEGMDSLSTGAEQVNTGAKALKKGADDVNSGASELDNGAAALHKGTGDLKTGTADLDNGASELLNGVILLDDGAVKLDDGTLKLLEGMDKFRSEGIDRLAEVFGGELEDVLDRLTAISDAGTGYRSFSGTSDNENDSVKFIFRTEGVKAD